MTYHSHGETFGLDTAKRLTEILDKAPGKARSLPRHEELFPRYEEVRLTDQDVMEALAQLQKKYKEREKIQVPDAVANAIRWSIEHQDTFSTPIISAVDKIGQRPLLLSLKQIWGGAWYFIDRIKNRIPYDGAGRHESYDRYIDMTAQVVLDYLASGTVNEERSARLSESFAKEAAEINVGNQNRGDIRSPDEYYAHFTAVMQP